MRRPAKTGHLELTARRDEPPRKPKAILFDWDNTLVDSWPIIHDALCTTFKAFGRTPWTLEETRKRTRKSMRDRFPDLFGEEWEEAAEVFYARYGAIHTENLRPLEGAEEMLAELSHDGIYLAIVSNKTGKYLRIEAENLGWTGYLGQIIGANDALKDKPAVEPVAMALKRSGIDPGQDVWFAGDADIDLECAHNAFCVPILVRENAPEPGEFNSHPPDHYFDGCQSLCNFVRNL